MKLKVVVFFVVSSAAAYFGAPTVAQPVITQLTSSVSGDAFQAVISTDGSTIALVSTADLTGNNSDGGQEIFVIRPDGTGLQQLTASEVSGFTDSPSITGDGLRRGKGNP